MQCKNRKCGAELPDGAKYCHMCGRKQSASSRKSKSRGNGTGTVYQLPNGKYIARVTLGYIDGKRKTASKTFVKKSDAILALSSLKKQKISPITANISFADAYNDMISKHEQKVGKSTIDNYKYAMAYYKPIAYLPLKDIKTEHLQRCIDACNKGTRTKENMKAVASLIFKYAMQNDIVEKNYAEYLYLGKKEHEEREPFSNEEVKKIYSALDTVDYAGYILCLIFTGFRPNEMFNLKKSDYHDTYFIGGSKTSAGRDRIIPIPNVILPYVQHLATSESEYMFPAPNGGKMDLSHFRTRCYYPALKKIGVRLLPPYSCRHTYATMLKDIKAPATDKQKLMGHASFEMTAHYTHTDLTSLEKITNKLKIE